MPKKKLHRKTRSKRKVHQPVVMVSIPRNAKLIVKRKKHSPYYMDVTDHPDHTSDTHHIWYSPDYQSQPGGAQ